MLASDWLYMILIGEATGPHKWWFDWSFDSCFEYLPQPQEINNALRDAEELKKAHLWGFSQKGKAVEINKPD